MKEGDSKQSDVATWASTESQQPLQALLAPTPIAILFQCICG